MRWFTAPVAAVLVGLLMALAGPALAQPATQPPARAVAPDATVAGAVVADLAEEAAEESRRIRRTVERAARAGAAGAAGDEEAEVPPALTDGEVTAIAETSGEIQDWIADHPIARTAAEFDDEERRWTVFFVSRDDDGAESTEAQALISDETGEITEVRVGPQVAWMMARGYPGAFGRAVNRPEVWLPLCALFLLPLLPVTRLRRLVSWRTLDLLALLSFSLSLIWFNRGEIFTSVPLTYPPMIYLGLRMAWIGISRGRAMNRVAEPDEPEPRGPRRPGVVGWAPTWLLATLLIVAMALRLGLNAFDSNVIDVGYAGVIGADRIGNGITPYGTTPEDCGSCDTYGPLNYLAYVPFESLQPWTGTWDDLPAAHGAASMFDLLCLAGMIFIGWRLASLRLGLTLGLAWAAFPFTAYTLLTNSNDALVAAGLIWGVALLHRPMGRGVMLGLALATKFAPGILLALWSRRPFPRPTGRRQFLPYAGGLALAGAGVGWVLLLDGLDGVRAFWSRTIAYQFGRESPFSLWGQYPALRPLQLVLMAVVVLGALALLRWPRRLDMVAVCAFSAALLIGAQLTLTHWFYLYIPWFLPLVLIAIVPAWPAPRPRPAPEPAEAGPDEREAPGPGTGTSGAGGSGERDAPVPVGA
ncbi:MAG: glycosyltransferase family 87 protein [Miltoncostaeaceae bacterium]